MDVLYNTLETAAAQLERETGCVVTILVGGPQPRLGRKITTWMYVLLALMIAVPS